MRIFDIGKRLKGIMEENLKNYEILDQYFAGSKEVNKETAKVAWTSLRELQTKMATLGMKGKIKGL